jgi:hypothetical protein
MNSAPFWATFAWDPRGCQEAESPGSRRWHAWVPRSSAGELTTGSSPGFLQDSLPMSLQGQWGSFLSRQITGISSGSVFGKCDPMRGLSLPGARVLPRAVLCRFRLSPLSKWSAKPWEAVASHIHSCPALFCKQPWSWSGYTIPSQPLSLGLSLSLLFFADFKVMTKERTVLAFVNTHLTYKRKLTSIPQLLI